MNLGIRRVYRDIRDRSLLSKGERAAVAFSGGPDSLCLLHLLAQLRETLDLKLHALHVNHGLRPEGKDEAARARALAEAADVPFTLLEADLDRTARGNLQERARLARRALLERAADELGCGPIALGHTADDQAETVIMRAVRGAGPRGLAGMAWHEGRIIRPLLAVTRRQVEEHLATLHLGASPVRDPTNLEDGYFRNRLRRQVMPLLRQENPEVVRALCRMADICREEDSALEQLALAELERATLNDGTLNDGTLNDGTLNDGTLNDRSWDDGGLHAPALAALPAAMLPRVLLLAYHRARGDTRRLERQHVQAMVDLVHGPGQGTRSVDLPRLRLERRYDALVWVERRGREPLDLQPFEPFEVAEPGSFPLPDGASLEVRRGDPETLGAPDHAHLLDPAAAEFPLEVRPPRPGDRLETGPGRHRKVARLLGDAKMPRGRRWRIPLLFSRKTLVLVVGVRAACGASAHDRGPVLAVWEQVGGNSE